MEQRKTKICIYALLLMLLSYTHSYGSSNPEYGHIYASPIINNPPAPVYPILATTPDSQKGFAPLTASQTISVPTEIAQPRIPVFLHPNLGVTVSSFNTAVLQQAITGSM